MATTAAQQADNLKILLKNLFLRGGYDDEGRVKLMEDVLAFAEANGATLMVATTLQIPIDDPKRWGYTVARGAFARFGTKEAPEWVVLLVDLDGVVQVVRPFGPDTEQMEWLNEFIRAQPELNEERAG